MKNLIISHSADWDGMFSAAIAKQALGDNPQIVLLNYGDEIPFDVILSAETVYMTDFTLPLECMKIIARKTILLDHHAPKLFEINREIGLENFKDANVDIDGTKSGAQLTWEYFYRNKPMPFSVELVSIYDVFLKKSPRWQSAYQYQLGLRLWELSVESAEKLIRYSEEGTVMIINEGETYRKFKVKESTKAFNDYSWDVKLKDYPTVRVKAILTSDMQSIFCEPILTNGEVDVVFMINRAGVDNFKISVRVSSASTFNASEFCKKFGGGGHEKAAGCSISTSEFLNLMKGEI